MPHGVKNCCGGGGRRSGGTAEEDRSFCGMTKEDRNLYRRLEDTLAAEEEENNKRDVIRRLIASSGVLDNNGQEDEEEEEDEEDEEEMAERQKIVNKTKAQQFAQTPLVRRLHSAYLLTEVMKGREAQAELKRRIQNRSKRDQQLQDQQRKREAVSHKEKMQLWREKQQDKYRQNQVVRDVVFDKLTVTQRELERRRRAKDEETFRKDMAEVGVQKAAMMQSVEKHKELRREAQRRGGTTFSDYDLFTQMAEKRARDWKQKKEQLDYAARQREQELEQEKQFQEYADYVIRQAAEDKRNLFALNRARREGISGGAGAVYDEYRRRS